MFKDKEKEKGAGFTLNLKTLVNLALLTALYVVLERFLSINMWNMRIGFAFIALALLAERAQLTASARAEYCTLVPSLSCT